MRKFWKNSNPAYTLISNISIFQASILMLMILYYENKISNDKDKPLTSTIIIYN